MRLDLDLRRTWLFGKGAGRRAHEAMRQRGADGLIVDLEDFTPASRRDEARRGLVELLSRWRQAGYMVAVRINSLDNDGPIDLAAACRRCVGRQTVTSRHADGLPPMVN